MSSALEALKKSKSNFESPEQEVRKHNRTIQRKEKQIFKTTDYGNELDKSGNGYGTIDQILTTIEAKM